jgi:hypothetical protein
MHELEIRKSALESDPEKLGVLFKEMIQICLWYVSAWSVTGAYLQTVNQGKCDCKFTE